MLPPRHTGNQHYGWLLQPPTPSLSEYDDASALTEYVWRHYPHLLTAAEARAGLYDPPLDRETAIRLKSPRFADHLNAVHGPAHMSELDEELRFGKAALYERACQRILREHGAAVFINRCAACERIVRSPAAQQCLWCKHDWHAGGG